MEIRSLGLRTDVALLTLSGSEVEDRGTHLVVRTPANPDYYWGNFFLLDRAPVPGGEREVVGAFRTEFPRAHHVSIAIDQPELTEEATAAFEAAGLSVDASVVLTATSLVQPLAAVGAPDVRRLESDEDWEARAQLSLALESGQAPEGHLDFARRRNEQERALETAGLGGRFGAFVEDRLVSTAAIFRAEDGVARYQSVETHPDHRRQGLAAAMVHAAGEFALADLGARTLVIVADDEGPAIGMYRRLGFADAERVLHLEARSTSPRA